MRIKPELASTTIVLVGNFNPMIFHPEWFFRVGIWDAARRDAAKVEVLHPEIASLEMDWLRVRAEATRFAAECTEEPYVQLFEFVLKVFGENLVHTPVTKLGINYHVHFRVADQAQLDAVGVALAPDAPWGEWGPRLRSGKGVKHGGLRSITMEQRDLDDRQAGHIQATVQPSVKIIPGVYVAMNDHFELDGTAHQGCEEIMKILQGAFEPSLTRAKRIVDQVMALVIK